MATLNEARKFLNEICPGATIEKVNQEGDISAFMTLAGEYLFYGQNKNHEFHKDPGWSMAKFWSELIEEIDNSTIEKSPDTLQ
ncbi:MAG: hypothetical protein ACJAYB_000035 [Psychromonas sp.]|jgi:hypothetical protein